MCVRNGSVTGEPIKFKCVAIVAARGLSLHLTTVKRSKRKRESTEQKANEMRKKTKKKNTEMKQNWLRQTIRQFEGRRRWSSERRQRTAVALSKRGRQQ